MGLACAVPMHDKPNIVVGDQRVSCIPRTANACSGAYVAPEFLCAHHGGADYQYYGYGADVWSAAAVSFELACSQRYCRRVSSPAAQFSDIVCRLGKPPESFFRFVPEAIRKIAVSVSPRPMRRILRSRGSALFRWACNGNLMTERLQGKSANSYLAVRHCQARRAQPPPAKWRQNVFIR